jgi:hypothetical protein
VRFRVSRAPMRASVPLADSAVIKPDRAGAATSTAVRRSPLLKTTPRTAAVLRGRALKLRCTRDGSAWAAVFAGGGRAWPAMLPGTGARGLRCPRGTGPRGRDIMAAGSACASLFFALSAGIRCAGAGDWLSGRAPRSHRGGHWFDPSIAHQGRVRMDAGAWISGPCLDQPHGMSPSEATSLFHLHCTFGHRLGSAAVVSAWDGRPKAYRAPGPFCGPPAAQSSPPTTIGPLSR